MVRIIEAESIHKHAQTHAQSLQSRVKVQDFPENRQLRHALSHSILFHGSGWVQVEPNHAVERQTLFRDTGWTLWMLAGTLPRCSSRVILNCTLFLSRCGCLLACSPCMRCCRLLQAAGRLRGRWLHAGGLQLRSERSHVALMLCRSPLRLSAQLCGLRLPRGQRLFQRRQLAGGGRFARWRGRLGLQRVQLLVQALLRSEAAACELSCCQHHADLSLVVQRRYC